METDILDKGISYLNNNGIQGAIIGGATGLAVGGIVGAVATRRSNKKKTGKRKRSKSTNRKKRSNNSRSRKRKSMYKNSTRRRKQRKPHTAGKRKDTSHRRIRWTKNNRPYIIKSDGRAKFIKMSSVRSSKKRKGGKY